MMRLKQLELQGYKSFASRTQFLFDGGITAIVGPNGSGKSNIADAIRWVLGEQSYRALRGKRTEDMIFSGSAQRARLGMASVSLTLDNADGWLPVEFGEVLVTRRAYRSGENEYLLNGQRVRLRDISELLSKSGLAERTYTVVGQGLVDAVLSLRPEDRRALFEEAAGIGLYRERRAEALARMDETRANLVRVNDIANEIAPRMARLEREADRAERHRLLGRQLEELLRTWYGFRWQQAHLDLRRSRDAAARRERQLARHQQALEELDGRLAEVRARQSRLREQQGAWHRESSDLHRHMEELQRSLAVWHEQDRLLARQGDELESELAQMEGELRVISERVANAEADLASSEAVLRAAESHAAAAQAELDGLESQRAEVRRQVAAAERAVLESQSTAGDLRRRIEQGEKRLQAIDTEREEHQQAIRSQSARLDDLRSQLDSLSAEQGCVEAEAKGQAAEAVRLRADLRELQDGQQALRSAVAEAQRGVDRLRVRHELLQRLREEGSGLHAGARAVLQAASKTQDRRDGSPSGSGPLLRGILGTVAQLTRVAPDYEIAVEVALGSHLQDIVVETWPDAERAIAYLRDGQKGRATFLPLDTVRPAGRVELPPGAGIIGIGADLVEADSSVRPVVELLLGRTVVVEDLKAARRTFERLRGGFQIVTVGGEILRSGGSVTAGEARGEARGQVLAREREWRDLPEEIREAEERLRRDEAALESALDHESHRRDELHSLEARQRETEKELSLLGVRMQATMQAAEPARQQVEWRQGQVSRLETQTAELAAQRTSALARLERLREEEDSARRQVIALQEHLARLHDEGLYQRASEARSASSRARGTWEHRRATLDALRERQEGLQSQVQAKRQRLASLRSEQKAVSEQALEHSSQEQVIRGWLASLAQKIEPADQEVARLESERDQLLAEESLLRGRLREAENSHAQALLAQSRADERLKRLRRQIVDDFGLVEMEPVEGVAEQLPLPLADLVSTLPAVDSLPEGLEDDIHQIRAQMKRMGSVNPTAPEEYAEVRDRHAFLTGQAADLEEAALRLRQVIAEMDDAMRTRFQQTFEQVAVRFRSTFSRLFDGGTARLMLTEPDDLSSSGVEILVSPPGKRQQALALLSGGERALTAAALIFALLDCSPPPFCVLDEVDAMLDEANVKRFRHVLQELSGRTQFIVITHNRTTVDAAQAVYGVSMGEDSVSQVVSLRLDRPT